MSRRALIVALVFLGLVCGISCGPKEQSTVEQDRQAVARTIQPVSYKRSGGRNNDLISIAQDGVVRCTGATFGSAGGKLSEFQMMRLARLFDGWEKLADRYSGPAGAADAASIEITYGPKSVVASESATGLPEQFLQARHRLESLARELPATP